MKIIAISNTINKSKLASKNANKHLIINIMKKGSAGIAISGLPIVKIYFNDTGDIIDYRKVELDIQQIRQREEEEKIKNRTYYGYDIPESDAKD